MIYQPSLFAHINSRYHAFKSEVLKDSHCEAAQFCERYMDIIQMVLTLISSTRKTTLNCMSAPSVCLVPNVHCKRTILWGLARVFVTGKCNRYLLCCFTSQVNSYGHCGTVSSPNHTFSWAGLNKRLTSNSCTYFRL